VLNIVRFQELSAIALDFIDDNNGFLYFRMAGLETVVNAISAQLLAKDKREKRWDNGVAFYTSGAAPALSVAGQKAVNYRVLRTRLPGGAIDMAIVHPHLTLVEDTSERFYLLSYEAGIPANFFGRLNRVLSIPLKQEWTPWLWNEGRRLQSWPDLEPAPLWGGRRSETLLQVTWLDATPIDIVHNQGLATCYLVRCSGRYKDAWLHLIRQQLNLGVVLNKVVSPYGETHYLNGKWSALPSQDGWTLYRESHPVTQAPSLDHLVIQAERDTGTYFIVQERD
jgi:hypothetical protein